MSNPRSEYLRLVSISSRHFTPVNKNLRTYIWTMLTELCVNPNQSNCNLVKVINLGGFWFGGNLAASLRDR